MSYCISTACLVRGRFERVWLTASVQHFRLGKMFSDVSYCISTAYQARKGVEGCVLLHEYGMLGKGKRGMAYCINTASCVRGRCLGVFISTAYSLGEDVERCLLLHQ